MKTLFSNLKIGYRIHLPPVLPFVAALAFSGVTIVTDWNRHSDVNVLLTLGALAPKVSDLVHELQKERGMPAGFSSKGQM